MYYPCSENKGADQLRGYREADLRLCFRIGRLLVFSRTGSYISMYLYIHGAFIRIQKIFTVFSCMSALKDTVKSPPQPLSKCILHFVNLRLLVVINSYKPGVLIMGHRQTVYPEMGCHRIQRPIWRYSICF